MPLDLFTPGDQRQARRVLGLPADEPICLYVGRLDREKSVERVIDAFGVDRRARCPAAACCSSGRAATSRRSGGTAEASPAAARIVFHGGMSREALPAYYQAADLFLFASETETQGLVLAEAHACGLPAVAVRASGVDEVVRDGETGLLTKAETGDLADAAIGLLLDRERRIAMGRAARLVAERAVLRGPPGRGHGARTTRRCAGRRR